MVGTACTRFCPPSALDALWWAKSRTRRAPSPTPCQAILTTLRRDPIHLGQFLTRERPSDGAGVHGDLLRCAGAGNDARHRRLRQQPREGKLHQAAAARAAECFQRADDAPVALADETLGMARAVGEAAVAGHGIAPVLSGE